MIVKPKKVKIELLEIEVENIVEELERSPYNVYTFMNYAEIIKKLRRKGVQK